MTPGVRKLALTTHVVSSLGWLGAVAAFLVLSVAALKSQAPDTVRSSYIAMNLIGQFIIVPLGLAALVTGLIQALGTEWGLFRHYWVLTKFALTLLATTLLLMHQFTAVAGAARIALGATASSLPDVGGLGRQLVFDAAAAIVVLVFTAALSIYKPWGRTPHGASAMAATAAIGAPPSSMPLGMRVLLTIAGLIVATVIAIHLAGGGLGHH